MDESLTECALLDFGPVRAGKRNKTGKSEAGKKVSSQNARKHGCRSKEKIIPGERREEYDALWAEWLEQYHPESAHELAHVGRIVDAEWRLRRAERAYTRLERALHKHSLNPEAWPAELLHRLQVMQRYRTAEQNTLHKEVRMLEFLKERREEERREVQEQLEAAKKAHPPVADVIAKVKADEAARLAEKRLNPSPAEALFQGQRCAAAMKPSARLEQIAEISVVRGRTVTELFPSNAELIAEGQAMAPPPAFVYRRLNFRGGIPAEYAWVGVRDEKLQARGGSGWQKMTADAWLALIEREAAEENGHLLPTPHAAGTGSGNACDCAVCVTRANIWRGERWGEGPFARLFPDA